MRGRLSGIRYWIADLPYAIGRRWRSIPIHARRRIVALAALVGAVAAFVVLAVPSLPCEFPGGDGCPPADDAAQIVPADSLAYLHANVDPDTEQYEAAARLSTRIPLFTDQLVSRGLARLPGPNGRPPDFERDIAPWFGGEVAVAVLPGGAAADQEVVALEIGDADGASEFAASIAAGRQTTEPYRGFDVTVDERGVASTQIDDFLVIGSQAGVRAVIETGSGDEASPPIGADEIADELRDELPDERLAEAYLSPEGAATLLEGSAGVVGALAPFVAPGSTAGAAASLSVAGDALELSVRSRLDPERERASPSLLSAFPEFEPELPATLGRDALAYLGIGAPGDTVRALLGQASARAPAIASGLEGLVRALARHEAVDLERELLAALGGEAAFAIEPAPGVPYLQFIASGVEEEAARRALASLQRTVAEDAGFDERQVGGVGVRSLRVSPAVELAYAVFDGLAVIATDPAGVAQIATGEGGLDESDRYRQATDGFGDRPSLLAYLDLRGLLAVGFDAGLAQVPAFNSFADDFRHLDALGLEVRASEDGIATEARLVLGEGASAYPSPDQ